MKMLAEHLVIAIMAVSCFAALTGSARLPRFTALPRLMGGALVLAGAALILAYLAACVLYLASPVFLDHFEPTIASVSWYFQQGKAVYCPVPASDFYLTYLGPYLYVINGSIQGLLGPSLASAKLGGVIAGCGSVLAVYGIARRSFRAPLAVLAAALVVALQLNFRHYSFWNRPDSFLVFLVSAACLAVTLPPWGAAVALGLAAGVCVNLKVHAILYLLPLFACVRPRLSLLQVALALAIGFGVWLLPFGLFPNLSLPDYVAALRMTGAQGVEPWIYAGIFKWCARLAIPFGLAAYLAYRQDPARARRALGGSRAPLALLAVALGLMILPSSKSGSGVHHYMPFLPVMVLLAARLDRDGLVITLTGSRGSRAVHGYLAAWAACILAFAVFPLWKIGAGLEANGPARAAEASDLRTVLARYGRTHTVLMGQAGDAQYATTFLRPLLVFQGMPIGLEPSSLMDFKKAGGAAPLPGAIGQAPARPVLWMIPRGQAPFTMKNVYYPNEDLYGERFRQAFHSRFRVSGQTPHFDLYTARAD